MQSLNNQLASKDEDLQAQHERCSAKDEQIANLAQRLEQLETTAEEQKQAETTRHAHSPRDWAVDVSLDQGMGTGPAPLMPSSPTALRQRVLVLEVGVLSCYLCSVHHAMFACLGLGMSL